jgi:hypothetical protein
LVIRVLPAPANEVPADNEAKGKHDDSAQWWWNRGEWWSDHIVEIILALATVLLWIATKNLVKGAENTAKKELRAYMGVERIRIYQDPSDTSIPGNWNIKVRNFGKTMAKDTETWIEGTIGDGKRNTFGNRRSKTVVMPNEAMAFEEAIAKTQADVDGFRHGYTSVYVWGRISYKDVFDKDHWTSFRFKSGNGDAFISSESNRREWKVRTDGDGANDAN